VGQGMMRRQFRVNVPATSANLGPGFDCMGIAVSLFNEMVIDVDYPFSVHIEGEAAELLPHDETNVVVQAIRKVLDVTGTVNVPKNWKLSLHNRIAVAGGLGSSASAIVGGLLLGNALVADYDESRKLHRQELLDLAIAWEGHPDNVTAALLGGAWLSYHDNSGHHSLSIPLPQQLVFVAAVPFFQLQTEQSRRVVPHHVARSDAIFNIAQASRLMLALSTGKLDMLRGGFGDRIHEPYRKTLIPGYEDVRQAAVRAGALTVTLSGAGPTMLAWCDNMGAAWQVADMMTLSWREFGIPCRADVYHPILGETVVDVRKF